MLETRPAIDEYLETIKASPAFSGKIVHHEFFPALAPNYENLPADADPFLGAALDKIGVPALYSHQAAGIKKILQQRSIILATPTASGKSLVYNLPILSEAAKDPSVKALYLFPLKALAQDQLRSVNELSRLVDPDGNVRAAILDGDTPAGERKFLRKEPPHILITNPDMLHLSLLCHHSSWTRLWVGLRYIVIDEAHSYRGIFGSHMAWVLRRLRRICRGHGREPQCILASATMSNPGPFAEMLLGSPVDVVSESGAPRGGRHFLFYNPIESVGHAASLLLETAMKQGLRTIVYTQSRKMTELIALWTQNRLGDQRNKLTAYRAGFLPEDRREIEGKLAEGTLTGVVSTSALELGIDIGGLDLCILAGYPGTIMSTWQRGGRVGRRQRDSLIILIGQEDALDQYFMRNPQDFFRREMEAAVLNPYNAVILEQHLPCAAAEAPLAADESLLQDEAVLERIRAMEEEGKLLRGKEKPLWFAPGRWPHRNVDIRGSGRSYLIRKADTGEPLGEIDAHRCMKECHPGAVYLHRGATWLVQELNIEERQVSVLRKDVHYFTRSMAEKETEILKIHRTKKVRQFSASLGYVRVTERVTAYQRKLVRHQKLLSTHPLHLPPNIFETEGFWIEIPPWLQKSIEQKGLHFMGGIHALEHAAIGIFPLLVLCDRNDIGGIAHPTHPALSGAAVFIYDGYPGGVGIAREVFAKLEELVTLVEKTIRACGCELGCPSCIHSPKCGSGNRPMDKEAAVLLVKGLLATGQGEKENGFSRNGKPQRGDAKQPETRLADLAAPPPSPEPSAGSEQTIISIPPFQGMVMRDEAQVTQPRAPRKKSGSPHGKKEGRIHYGVFDLETKRSAEEVGGWNRADRMGMSIAVVYDSLTGSCATYREEEAYDLISHLKRLDLIVGFNILGFDYRVLSAYTREPLHLLPTLDLLQEIKKRLGYRLSLDGLAEHTLHARKSGDGLQALQWYREGLIEKIAEYCRKDVEITRDLFLFAVRNRQLFFRNKARQVVTFPLRLNLSEEDLHGTG